MSQVRTYDLNRYYYDERAVELVNTFFEKKLFHTKGKWAGKPFKLQEWQREAHKHIFGWKEIATGFRKHRTVYIEIPKKNGKSEWAAGLALYLTCADGEKTADVYTAAIAEDQAAIVFNMALAMRNYSHYLKGMSVDFKKSIFFPGTGSTLQLLTGAPESKDGKGPSACVLDEVHALKKRDMYDVITTGMAARDQGLMIMITTAGFDKESLCYDYHELVKKVNDGTAQDDSLYGVIYSADKEDDYFSKKTWKKANPGYGITVNPGYLRAKFERARNIPADLNSLLRYHLNIWTSAETPWLNLEKWKLCQYFMGPEGLKGRSCFGGLDLSSNTDLSSYTMVFPPVTTGEPTKILTYFFMPEDNIKKRDDETFGSYSVWRKEGDLIATPGNVINQAFIEDKVLESAKEYTLIALAVDRWNADYIGTRLADEGIAIIPFGQGYVSMSPPAKELEKKILSKKIAHADNKVMNWMVDHVVVKEFPGENIKPMKPRPQDRIDGIITTTMALGISMLPDLKIKGPSVYNNRGLRVL